MNGLYIVFEGTVGTGKSTQSKKLYDVLKKKFPDKEIILTREPGGSEIAEEIRNIVQGTNFEEKMEPICEAYLYASSRAQTLRKIVEPVLNRDGIVIADRSFISSAAYQGIARDIGINRVLEINKVAVDDISPDVIIYINLDPEVGLKRTFDEEGDKFEKEDAGFFRRIERGYNKISEMSEYKKKWHNIDGTGTIEEVHKKILDVLNETLRHLS